MKGLCFAQLLINLLAGILLIMLAFIMDIGLFGFLILAINCILSVFFIITKECSNNIRMMSIAISFLVFLAVQIYVPINCIFITKKYITSALLFVANAIAINTVFDINNRLHGDKK